MSKIKKYLQELDRTLMFNAVFIFSMLCISLVFIFALVNGAKQILGAESVGEVVTVISSLATALTLIFLVYQHRDNASKSYQMIMVEEAKLTVDKMMGQIDYLNKWDCKDIYVLGSFLAKMTNHIGDFDAFFNEVKDNALRTVLLVRWQDMYFNHYISAVKRITVESIIKRNVRYVNLDMVNRMEEIFEEAKNELESGRCNEYQSNLYVLAEAKKRGVFVIPDNIGKHVIFKHYFLEENQLNKFLQGAEKDLDTKKKYPSLYAIVETSIIG